jgi:hypothetical protein
MWEISPEAVITIGFVLVCAIATGFGILFNAVVSRDTTQTAIPATGSDRHGG